MLNDDWNLTLTEIHGVGLKNFLVLFPKLNVDDIQNFLRFILLKNKYD